jgi:hypothetical protein
MSRSCLEKPAVHHQCGVPAGLDPESGFEAFGGRLECGAGPSMYEAIGEGKKTELWKKFVAGDCSDGEEAF